MDSTSQATTPVSDKLAGFRAQTKAELAAKKAAQSARGRKQAATGQAALERFKANKEANERLLAWFSTRVITINLLKSLFERIRQTRTPRLSKLTHEETLERMAHKAMHFLAKKPKLETIHDLIFLGELLPEEDGYRVNAAYQMVPSEPMPWSQFLKRYPHPACIEPEVSVSQEPKVRMSRRSLAYRQQRMLARAKKRTVIC